MNQAIAHAALSLLLAVAVILGPPSEGLLETVHAASPQPSRDVDGIVAFDITDILGRDLAAKAELRSEGDGARVMVPIPSGRAEIRHPVGPVVAYVWVYDQDVPVLVDVQDIVVRKDERAYVLVTLLEGSSGNRRLLAFDQDFDLALDRVEIKVGTDPTDASSIPGVRAFEWESPVLSANSRWYRGELHTHSTYGTGSETVAELVKRAERLGLDFLAITDRNTMDAASDRAFRSKSVVLIPALEWGNDEMGVALVYRPGTFPAMASNFAEAQALSIRVQVQGGIFAIAHPCFPTAPWQWNLRYVNAVEVWCRDWSRVPPMGPAQLQERLRERKDGRRVHAMAIAAATQGRSANGQAALFWDLEMNRGLKAGVIGGSHSASPKVAMASPVTYVYAREKSLDAIIEGIRRGQTTVSRSLDGPTVSLSADILNDGRINAHGGGFVPLHVPTRFIVEVQRGKGKKLQVLLNGLPIRSMTIDSNELTYAFVEVPDSYAVYRAQVLDDAAATRAANTTTKKRKKESSTGGDRGRFATGDRFFGRIEMLAMCSPIYAQEVIAVGPGGADDLWVRIENEYFNPATAGRFLPRDPSATELKPRWRF